MWKSIQPWLLPVEGIPAWQFYLRVAIILVELFLAYTMAHKADPFFYQAF